tara:strand:- start:274402 stop:275445 length:1044 start_codon:yes stop_codon:yes gene_type:complete
MRSFLFSSKNEFTIKLLLPICLAFSQFGSSQNKTDISDFTIAFGSCNKTQLPNLYWDDILKIKPDVFIWGGDVVYADTDNMKKMTQFYARQNEVPAYKKLRESIPIMGTWDDHDYGLNDGGAEYTKKDESQQLFLDFLNVSKSDPRRTREGIYYAKTFTVDTVSVKVIMLDTRYFRSALTPATEKGKRYKPNDYGEGTMLGDAQWDWLQDELTGGADYNVIMSSIQFLSAEHGFETWGNFPHEVDRFIKLLQETKANNVIVLSGDRHISEFSKKEINGLNYPLIDFTGSGLTHSYTAYSGEPNKYRVGEVVSLTSFETLDFDFMNATVTFKIRGDDGKVLQELKQVY